MMAKDGGSCGSSFAGKIFLKIFFSLFEKCRYFNSVDRSLVLNQQPTNLIYFFHTSSISLSVKKKFRPSDAVLIYLEKQNLTIRLEI